VVNQVVHMYFDWRDVLEVQLIASTGFVKL